MVLRLVIEGREIDLDVAGRISIELFRTADPGVLDPEIVIEAPGLSLRWPLPLVDLEEVEGLIGFLDAKQREGLTRGRVDRKDQPDADSAGAGGCHSHD